MSRRLAAGTGIVVLVVLPLTGEDETRQVEVDRGRYLVHHVGMCVQCHSPRDDQGELIETRLLTGGRIPVPRPYPEIAWAAQSPRLAGLPGWDDAEVIALLVSGHRPNGVSPRPPMPPFRLTRQDAAAVVAYLRSL